ncbi:hypothetical protein [Ureibacillus thermosphaericus]|uniref:hypothetical protein n=1 Tax=Ureibacillus thermosphaericus TaxID=51173 RepID=UPI000BBBC141|nr:hypothetical protein [Ureibacillus thermosphaericus]
MKKILIYLMIITLIFSSNILGGISTTHAKNKEGNFEILVNNPQKIKLKAQHEDIVAFLEFDKNTGDITYKTNEKNKNGKKEKEYIVEVEEATKEGVIAKFTDTDNNEEYIYNSVDASPSFAFVIPVGISLGGALIESLIGLGLAIIIGGVAYISFSEFYEKNDKKHNHYEAVLNGDGLFIGGGLSKSKAVSRLKSGKDTWSTTKSNAQTIAKEASPISKAIGPEIDKGKNGLPKVGYFYHYHVAKEKNSSGEYIRLPGKEKKNQNGVHAFYGTPYK